MSFFSTPPLTPRITPFSSPAFTPPPSPEESHTPKKPPANHPPHHIPVKEGFKTPDKTLKWVLHIQNIRFHSFTDLERNEDIVKEWVFDKNPISAHNLEEKLFVIGLKFDLCTADFKSLAMAANKQKSLLLLDYKKLYNSRMRFGIQGIRLRDMGKHKEILETWIHDKDPISPETLQENLRIVGIDINLDFVDLETLSQDANKQKSLLQSEFEQASSTLALDEIDTLLYYLSIKTYKDTEENNLEKKLKRHLLLYSQRTSVEAYQGYREENKTVSDSLGGIQFFTVREDLEMIEQKLDHLDEELNRSLGQEKFLAVEILSRNFSIQSHLFHKKLLSLKEKLKREKSSFFKTIKKKISHLPNNKGMFFKMRCRDYLRTHCNHFKQNSICKTRLDFDLLERDIIRTIKSLEEKGKKIADYVSPVHPEATHYSIEDFILLQLD
ncbi:hypothetical protein DID78_00260 [Candidatus Marinamargulisbacteria bacterium SCGC AG-343-D04]|nr:hypothetical protein DID78_00260 [Candidatus Marinamargulisbacteria bacterium SCGC AG-343-D04]